MSAFRARKHILAAAVAFPLLAIALAGHRYLKPDAGDPRSALNQANERTSLAAAQSSRDSSEPDADSPADDGVGSSSTHVVAPVLTEPPVTGFKGDRFAKAQVVTAGEIVRRSDAIAERTRLVRVPDEKHPMMRVVETFRHKRGARTFHLLRQVAMVADHVIVKLKPGVGREKLKELNAGMGASISRRLRLPDGQTYLVKLARPTVDAVARAIEVYKKEARTIAYAEPDYECYLLDTTPNDPYLNELYGLHNTGQTGGTADADIDAPEAWDIATGSHDVLVGVIDTGVDYNHPDLQANMWQNPGETGTDGSGNDKSTNGVDDDGNGYIDDFRGWDFYGNDNNPMDGHSHGTHCSGTIGATGNNGTGVVGVNWEVSIIGLKFLSDGGSGSTSDAVDAVTYATSLGCALTSNSWGGGGFSQALKDAIDAADAAGSLFVAAAGNDGINNDNSPHYPSSYDSANIIAVAATDHSDGLAYFSCYGPTSVDIGAPGVNTYSTVLNNGYGSKSGTSMATPHVSGVCALLKSLVPSLTHAEIKQRVMDGVDPVASLQGRCVTGGRLNAYNTLLFASGPFLILKDHSMVDDGSDGSSGNGDGLVNPGELIGLNTLLRNIGSETATSTTGTLSLVSANPFISIPQDTVAYGDIVSGGEVSGAGPFLVQIDPATPTPHQVEFELTSQDGLGNSWTASMSVTVYTSSQVEGQVSRLTGGDPIAGAVIAYAGPLSGSVTADANGAYMFGVIDGTYTLTASAPGFVDSAPTQISVPPSLTDVDFALGAPQIDVDPTSFAVALDGGATTTRALTIDNSGDVALTYSLSSSNTGGPSSGGEQVILGAGGPDNFGYRWTDSNEPGGPAYVWDDISTTGRVLSVVSGSDDTYEHVQLSFTFPFYENQFSSMYVGTNGFITFGAGSSDLSNDPLPSASAPANLVAGFFDDLNPGGSGNVYFRDDGDKAIVQFDNVRRFGGSGGNTFQMVLYASGAICFYYENMSGTLTSATVGIQNSTRNDGFAITYNAPYITNGLAVRIAAIPPWLQHSVQPGSVPPGGSGTETLMFDANGLLAGTYTADLTVDHSVPGTPSVLIPVSLTVNPIKRLAASPTPLDFGQVPIGGTAVLTLLLENPGNEATTVSGLSTGNPRFVHDAEFPLVIPAFGSSQIEVSLDCIETGTQTDTWVFSSDAFDNPSLTVDVSAEVTYGPLHELVWTPIASPQPQNRPFQATLTALNENGYVKGDFDGTVTLEGGYPTPANPSSRVVITECFPGDPDFIEIQNVTGETVQTIGWRVVVSDSYSNMGSYNTTVWNLPDSLAPGEVLYRSDSSSDNYWGSNIYWHYGYNIWALIIDDAGAVVDCVVVGWDEADISAFNMDIGGQTISLENQFSGPGCPHGSGSTSLQRIGSSDGNTAGDFEWISTSSKGFSNANLTLPFPQPPGNEVAITPEQISGFVGGVWTGELTVLEPANGMVLRARHAEVLGRSTLFSVIPNHAPSIVDGPTATPDPVSFPDAAILTVTASDPEGDPLTYTWSVAAGPGTVSFSENGSDAAQTSSASFSGPGLYTIEVEVGDGMGSRGTTGQVEVLVAAKPVADDQDLATAEDTPLSITLTASHSLPIDYRVVNGPLHGRLQAVTGMDLTYTPDANYYGPDMFVFEVEDTAGGLDTAIVSIDVTPVNDAPSIVSAPIVTPNPAVPGQEVSFIISVADVEDHAPACEWDFGDGSRADGETASHVYAEPGDYHVTVTVTDSAGVKNSASITVRVELPPAQTLFVSRFLVRVTFAEDQKEMARIQGTVELPADFDPSGLPVRLNWGGAVVNWVLDAKGKARDGRDTIRLKIRSGLRKRFAGGPVRFSARLAGREWSAAWAAHGLTDTQAEPATVSVPVMLHLGDRRFAADAEGIYKVKPGRGGKVKGPVKRR